MFGRFQRFGNLFGKLYYYNVIYQEKSLNYRTLKLRTFIWSLKYVFTLIIYLKSMKNSSILGGLILSCLVLSAFSQTCCNQNIIKVGGNGEVKIKPNVALIYASIQADGKTATQALSNIDTIISKVYNVLQVNGVSQNDITTSSISVYPKYDYTNGTGVIVGYTVYVSLTISLKGIDVNSSKIAKVIDGLAAAGVTSISGITYDTVDPNAGKAAARVNAWNDANNKAKQYAQLAGRKLGKVLSIEEVTQNYYPYYYGTSNASVQLANIPTGMNGSGATPQLPIGQINVMVYVVVVWQLV